MIGTRAGASLRVERRDDVVVAAIDRPERRNAADLAVYQGLEDVMALDGRAMVITGAHGVFSAGDDIAMFSFDSLEHADTFVVDVQRIFSLIEADPRPVVAAVDGDALGFGFEFALACDLVVVTEDARLGLPEIVHGTVPPNALGRGPSAIGRGLIRYLALTGRRWLDGREALEVGLAVELHVADRLVDEAVSLAREAAGHPHARHAKRLCGVDAEAAYREAVLTMPTLMAAPEVAESRERFFGG